MVRGTLLNSESVTRDTRIYRTLSVERFFELFEKKQNVVVRPSMWDDTFENLALSSAISIGDEVGDFEFKDDVYGQCWTLHTASDAIWRIYSNGTNGIRIRSTVGKLFDSLSQEGTYGPSGETFVGKVRYMSEKGLNEFAESHFINSGLNSKSIAETLLIKRVAFSHEKEIRLIYISDKRLPQSVLKYDIDPHHLVDQVLAHPQLPVEHFNRLKWTIENYLNFKGTVKRSLLYAPPKGFQFKIP